MYTYIAGKEPYFSFDVTEENMEAMEAVEEFSLEDGPQLLCIYGEKETGKSHLASVARDLLDEEGFRVRTLTEYDMIEGAISWMEQGKSIYDFYQKYEHWDGLILEDIHYYNEIGDPNWNQKLSSAQTAVLNLVNQFWVRGKKILVTCDCHLRDLEWFDEVEPLFAKAYLPKPSEELKRIVLRSYEHIAGVSLSEEVREIIIAHAKTISVMKNTFNQAFACHKFLGKELDEALFLRITGSKKKEEEK